MAETSRRVFAELKRHGLLLTSDATFPNVVALVVGGPVRGSWWAHPRAHDIYNVAHPLSEHADVIVTKLVSGKDTYVHRRLWPALLAIGLAREPWQTRGLSASAKKLLVIVSKDGALRTDAVPWPRGRRKDSVGEAARELERRLLVHGEDVHTGSGAHAKRLETWERWAKRAAASRGRMTAARGRVTLEQTIAELNRRYGAKARLPWQLTKLRARPTG